MAKLLQGKKVIDHDFETIIEEFDKQIKLILWPGKIKAFFLVVSLFDLTTNEKECVARLDIYLDIRDTCVAYQERTRKALQAQDQVLPPSKLEIDIQNKTALTDMSHERILAAAEDDQVGNIHK
ncbi:hypothetical protein D8674_010254 [Pyrus ussuriensis x Pyrus communis]|uniref:Uncharacterized protein n=1 Tax=Pyrus ussuriensis x Pyrus communis TaxID=2448454 RepID=A0A5N5FAZ1_9ROSA|nr:hypothetical protein D8674_010254 [Pyrus ussuriensis x Pyrus communis]